LINWSQTATETRDFKRNLEKPDFGFRNEIWFYNVNSNIIRIFFFFVKEIT